MNLATRRQFTAATLACLGAPAFGFNKAPKVGALFAGRIDDGGFMQAGWEGLERARSELGATTQHIANVPPLKEALVAALTTLAQAGPDLVLAHGGQNNEAVVEVCARFPNQRFVVTQGAVTGVNLASYEVVQEESAYLAGVLAASFTRSGVVGHMSGIRALPGLKGRAAFAAGVRATKPAVQLLSNFSGQQDDNDLSRRVALAQAAAGADVIFTMLNAGRRGAIDVCREKGIHQIGNVIDWVPLMPEVFIGSAIADVSIAVFDSIRDLQEDRFAPGTLRKLGLGHRQAVRLSMAKDVPANMQDRVVAAAEAIRAGRLAVPTLYDGPEFPTPN